MRTLKEIQDAYDNLEWRVRTLEAHGRDSDIERGHRDLERIREEIALKKRLWDSVCGSFLVVVLGDAVLDRISHVVCEMEWDGESKKVLKIYGQLVLSHPKDPEACYVVELR